MARDGERRREGAARRNTRQKDALAEVLSSTSRPLSPTEIHLLAKERVPKVGIATIYRSIKEMVADGRLVPVELPGEAPRYELAGKGHHHHFRCNCCNQVFEIEGCLHGISSLLPAGFTLDEHEILLVGRCQGCNEK